MIGSRILPIHSFVWCITWCCVIYFIIMSSLLSRGYNWRGTWHICWYVQRALWGTVHSKPILSVSLFSPLAFTLVMGWHWKLLLLVVSMSTSDWICSVKSSKVTWDHAWWFVVGLYFNWVSWFTIHWQKSCCVQALLDVVVNLQFGVVESLWETFWRHIPEKTEEVAGEMSEEQKLARDERYRRLEHFHLKAWFPYNHFCRKGRLCRVNFPSDQDDHMEILLGRSGWSSRFYHKDRPRSPQECFLMIVPIAWKLLTRQRRPLQQKRLYGNQA